MDFELTPAIPRIKICATAPRGQARGCFKRLFCPCTLREMMDLYLSMTLTSNICMRIVQYRSPRIVF